MPNYTPSTDTSTLVVSLGYAFQANFTGGTSAIQSVGFAFSASDVGLVIMVLSGDPNVNPGFTVTWSTVATFVDSSHITIGATLPGSSIAYVNVVLYRPLATGSAAVNSVESGSLEVDLSVTSFATAKFTIISKDGSLIPAPFMPILITDTEVSVEYFGGEVQDNQVTNDPGTTIARSHIQAVGWEVIAKRLTCGVPDANIDGNNVYGINNPAVGTFVNLRADQIADYFVSGSGYMRNDGVTGSYDTTGPTIPVFQAIAAKLSDVLDQLCSAATTPGKQFNWRFGPRKVLTIGTLNTVASPFNLSDGDGSSGNALAQLEQTLSNQNYFNRALATVDRITQQFVGDGSSRAFTLTTSVPFTALGQVSITQNGQNQTVGQLGTDKGKNWYYQTGSPTITQDASGTTLSTTDVLQVSFPVWNEIFIDDLPAQSAMAAQQSGSGTWEQKIDLQAVSTVVDAQSYTQAMLDEAKVTSQQVKLMTYRPGLNVGQTITVALTSIGVTSGSFLIDTLTITTANNRKLFTITASLDASYLGNWTRALKRGIGTASGVHGHPLAVPGTASAQIVASGGAGGGKGTGAQTVACEVPVGTIDGSNTVFTVSRAINSSPSPILMVNGVVQDPLNATVDFTFAGKTITYTVAPEVGAKHVIWYWYGDGSGNRARNFAGSTDSISYGNNLTYNIHGDLSIGMWILLNSASVGYLMFRGNGIISTMDANECYRLIIAGSSGSWNITVSWEFGSGPTQVVMTFTTAIPNNVWKYLGITRDATAKTVTLYLGDGTSVKAVGTQTYSTNPDGGTNAACALVVGNQQPINVSTNKSTIEEHYIWTRKLSASEHQSAMKGAPPSTNLVLNVQTGSSPEVDLSPTGASGTVTGTTLVAGHG